MQGAHPEPMKLHWKLAPGGLERKTKLASVSRTGPTGPLSIRVSGGVGVGGVGLGVDSGVEPGEEDPGVEPPEPWGPFSFLAPFAFEMQRCLALRCFLLFPGNLRLHFLI